MLKAVIFPGQGAQTVGMGKGFFDKDKPREILAECSEQSGIDLEKLIFNGPQSLLNETKYAQPAIFAVSLAIYHCLLDEMPEKPDYFAGFSLGQYTALSAGGAFCARQGARLLKYRGMFMHQAKEGKMAAVIGLKHQKVAAVLDNVDKYVTIANYNCPGQVVISGTQGGISDAADLLQRKGAKKVVPLKVSGAFHSDLMKDAAEKFLKVLDNESFSPMQVPVIANETAREIRAVKESLYTQLTSPVLWQGSVEYLRSLGVRKFIEVGPGSVLSGLVKRIDRTLDVINIQTPDDLDKLR